MKKVRYALGAVGLAPAVGMMMPAPTTAAATTNAPTGKTVSLQYLQRHPAPTITCGSSHVTNHRSTHHLRIETAYTFFDGGCVHFVQGELSFGQTHLSMRTRIYSIPGGVRVYQNYVNGHIGIFQSHTVFSKTPNVVGTQVCIALVSTAHHSKIIDNYGPICSSP